MACPLLWAAIIRILCNKERLTCPQWYISTKLGNMQMQRLVPELMLLNKMLQILILWHLRVSSVPSVLWHCWLGSRKGIRPVKNGGWWRWALVSPDGVAPSLMVGVSASVNLPLHHKLQKFSSGTGSPGWSRKKGHNMVVVVWSCAQCMYYKNRLAGVYFFIVACVMAKNNI